ncbi:MAG: acyltransferase [Planctomycetota bacterium]|nr:acyltransferase [Planctomycetota bacterium]
MRNKAANSITAVELRAGQRPRADQAIESLRGAAILMLIIYHSQGTELLSRHGVYANLHTVIDAVQMPLFAALAGYVYSLRPVTNGTGGTFLLAKAKRLLVPFFVAVTLTYVLRSVTPGVMHRTQLSQIWRVYLYSYEHFWFLQSLFLVFVAMVVLEPLGAKGLVTCLVIDLVVAGMMPITSFFSAWGFFYLLPPFLLGCGINRFEEKITGWLVPVAVLGLVAGLAALELLYFGQLQMRWTRVGPLGMSIGMSASFLLLRFRRPVPLLGALGACSYGIFLYHGFGLAVGQRLYDALHLAKPVLELAVKCSCGLLLPIAGELVIRRHVVTRRVFLGQWAK